VKSSGVEVFGFRSTEKGWAALAVKAAGKASGLRESRIAIYETQTRVVDELTNSNGPTLAKLTTMAERELGAFISAVTELFGSEQADDGFIEIDNNSAQSALRAVALGRKDYLFAGSDSGGERAAAIYSLIG
jgi:hypothetical protein